MGAERPKFRRAPAEERRDDLIAAALRSIARDGHAGVSVRRIAAEAGVSIGLINHYFPSIDDLVASAYEQTATRFLRLILDEVAKASPSPRARLSAFLKSSFAPPILDPALLHVWVVFWSLTVHSAPLREIQARTWADYRGALEVYLADCLADAGDGPGGRLGTARAALGLGALLDGLWLEWCLNPQSFAPEDGIAICEAFIDGLQRPAATT